jgi:hypothetical protein
MGAAVTTNFMVIVHGKPCGNTRLRHVTRDPRLHDMAARIGKNDRRTSTEQLSSGNFSEIAPVALLKIHKLLQEN